MPVARFADEQWGDVQWGEDEAALANLIVDQAQNPLAGPVDIEFLGWTSPGDEGFKAIRIYQFLIKAIRDADRENAFFTKRFLTGPETLWEEIEASHQNLKTLFDVDKIDDQYLAHLALQVGWTKDLEAIISKLDAQSLRRLIAESVKLWKRRGASGSEIEILNTIIGIDAWSWDWFDTRWVVGENFVGEDLQGLDTFMLDESGRRETNLRIVDPSSEIDRDLVNEIIKVWRVSGERVIVTYVKEFDRFTSDREVWTTFDGVSAGSHTIANGMLTQSTAADQHSVPAGEPLPQLQDYVFRARIRYGGTAGASDWYGAVFRHPGTAAGTVEATEIRIYPDSDEMRIYRGGSQVGASVDLKTDHGFMIDENIWRTMRVQVEYTESLNQTRYAVYLDNVLVLDQSSSEPNEIGTAGVAHGNGLTLDCSDFEIMSWPGENYRIGLQNKVTKFPNV